MLDVSLEGISAPPLGDITLTFPKSTHTALAGPPGAGASTLLRLVAGELRPSAGAIRIGAHNVTALRRNKRPLLYVTSEIDAPGRWSVRHLLIAAVRQRTLDRVDRQHELELAAARWQLETLLDRRLSALSSSERTLAHLARIELLRPAILVADRLLEQLNPSALPPLADELYRTLRVMGATVITAPSSPAELGFADALVVLDGGRVVQRGTPADVFRHPASEAAAKAAGSVNVVPITIRGTLVESPIGAWESPQPPFQGSGVALVRPGQFHLAERGEESDLIFGVEEANFAAGRWEARGVLSGGIVLHVSFPGEIEIHKGRLLPLRYDPSRFTLLAREGAPLVTVPTDVVPSLRDSR